MKNICSKSSQPWLRQPRNKRTASSSHEQCHDTVIVARGTSLWPLLLFCHTTCVLWVHTHTLTAYKDLPHIHTHTHRIWENPTPPMADKATQRVVLSLNSCSSLAYIIIFCFAAALAVDLYTLWICESKQRAQKDDIIWRVEYLCTTRQSWQFTMLSFFPSRSSWFSFSFSQCKRVIYVSEVFQLAVQSLMMEGSLKELTGLQF